MRRYNPEKKRFEEVKPEEYETNLFEKGVISFVPRDLALGKHELLGSSLPDEVESELEESDDESEADPLEDFTQEVEDLFAGLT